MAENDGKGVPPVMTAQTAKVVHPLRIADAKTRVRHVFIHDLVLDASIGVHDFEKDKPQRLRLNLDLAVWENPGPLADNLSNVVCYEQITKGVRDLIAKGHVNLVETLAEDIADLCLGDPRVRSVRVRVEKLDVFADATSVGVEIERYNTEE